MSYNFVRANASVIAGATPVSDFPFTISCWFKTSLTNTNQVLVGIYDSGGISNCAILLRPGSLLSVSARSSSSTVFANSTATYSTNTWTHACGVFSSTTSRTIYLNGANSATNTSIRTLDSPININIGNSTLLASVGLAGDICEIGIWNVDLPNSEISALANGISPKLLSPKDLIFYAPLIRNIYDYCGSTNISGVNSPSPSEHTRIYL